MSVRVPSRRRMAPVAVTRGYGAIKAPKLASVVAQRIEDDIVASGWPEGQVLGSETDLLERFGVSRAVVREAVRIIEHTGAARMRRGPGGGSSSADPTATPSSPPWACGSRTSTSRS